MEMFITNVSSDEETDEKKPHGLADGDHAKITRADGTVFNGKICASNSVGVAVVFDDDGERVSNEKPLQPTKMDFPNPEKSPDHSGQGPVQSDEQEPLQPTKMRFEK